MALLRVSANVGRVVHLLRAAGPEIGQGALGAFDAEMRAALGALLGGGVSQRSWEQAAGSVGDGGLGLRLATELQYPAFLASRTQARPLAEDLCVTMPAEHRRAVLECWDAEVEVARQALGRILPPHGAATADQLLEEGAADAARKAAQVAGLSPRDQPADGAGWAARVAAGLVGGWDDPEHLG